MTDQSSVDGILDFLKKNRFSKAEEALRNELNNRSDLNGFLQKLIVAEEKKDSSKGLEPRDSEVSKELIVKEIDFGTGVTNGSVTNKWENGGEKASKKVISREMSFTFSENSGDAAAAARSGNGTLDSCRNVDDVSGSSSLVDLCALEQSRRGDVVGIDKKVVETGEDIVFFGNKKTGSWSGSTSKGNSGSKTNETADRVIENFGKHESYMGGSVLLRTEDVVDTSTTSESWKECSVETLFQSSRGEASTSYNLAATSSDKREGKKKTEVSDVRAAIKEQESEVARALFFGKTQSTFDDKSISSLGFPLVYDARKEEFPRLPPVKLKSEDNPLSLYCEEKFERDGSGSRLINDDEDALLIGSYLDVPIGQEISSSGGKKSAGGNWLSVSQGIAEDASDLVSGFATIGDGLSESVDYRNEYWDSDEYEDDDDIGYVRQPIEDETWFLAHEIDYPSDHEKGTTRGSPDHHGTDATKDEEDQSYTEEASYLSGEQYTQAKDTEPISSENDRRLTVSEIYPDSKKNDLISQYDGQLMDEEVLSSMRNEPVWQGFVAQTNELLMMGGGDKKVHRKSHLDDVCLEDDQHDSVRSIGVGINSDAADFGSEVRESLAGGSSEGDFEYSRDHDAVVSRFKQLYSESEKKHIDGESKNKQKGSKNDGPHYIVDNDSGESFHVKKTQTDGGFSFGRKDGQLMHAESSKSLWSGNNNKTATRDKNAERSNDDMVATWRRKSSDSSSSVKEEDLKSVNSSPSSLSNYACEERKHADKEDDRNDSSEGEDDNVTAIDDEEAVAVQEQVRQIKAQEEEFETFNLKIVHRKNRTGFEEEKNFHVVLNSVIAGRYHVTEYLGSAAFSKAIQAHDLQTGMDVCIKIIKNNKDFFDQSLDEIKLLKYVNKHDPADKYHLLRLYDYFYYREHLLIVCELLKANLYEFHKFNRESGGEVYFTMPRLQSITIQCLEALQFLHGLGLIHCDLKPENILVKSYSRCEIKVIDLGSSCFETDHLCSYVQSRSYRAPEVILGLPYDKKIDVWSLGCILAELCTGNVLFQNDSPASLLARVMGIVGSIDHEMLTKGRDSHKYFTKNRMLYERNQESNRLEYLIPKRTSLRHRLPMGDQGFTDFVAHLLEINPKKRPSASEALKHPWLSYPYEPISA
ncbi:uncharacterized protein LOC108817640 [Raphanus sativus]|uniref:Uncharacterized protein LOC108817640 n=1 Tax=Raphanus sativus TaxID=3726 RepID=A0A6J0KD15_RAPSA|nr:uncharacterized protein LOC108817640 [Raphanus sativus]